MKIILLSLILAIGAVSSYWVFIFFQKVGISKVLSQKALAYQNIGTDYTKTLLVLGDSTGVGVGASSAEDSVTGRLATGVGATYVENHAKSGARIEELALQMEKIKRDRYSIILVQIGGNDIVRFLSAEDAALQLSPFLEILRKKSDKVYLLSAGNVGAAVLFPPPLRPFYSSLNQKYHTLFTQMAEELGVTYINLYEPKETDPFSLEPERYLASDGFHPSSLGYGLWYERLREKL